MLMSTNNRKKSGLQQENRQRVHKYSESGHEFKCQCMKCQWDKDKYMIIPYSPLLAEYDPGCRRQ